MRYRNVFCVLFFSTIASASTVWDGVYTGPQADRGLAVYTKNCGACHLADLGGRGESPALKGAKKFRLPEQKRLVFIGTASPTSVTSAVTLIPSPSKVTRFRLKVI